MALTSWSYQPLLYSPPLQGSFSNGSQAGICCQILFKMDVPAQNTKRHLWWHANESSMYQLSRLSFTHLHKWSRSCYASLVTPEIPSSNPFHLGIGLWTNISISELLTFFPRSYLSLVAGVAPISMRNLHGAHARQRQSRFTQITRLKLRSKTSCLWMLSMDHLGVLPMSSMHDPGSLVKGPSIPVERAPKPLMFPICSEELERTNSFCHWWYMILLTSVRTMIKQHRQTDVQTHQSKHLNHCKRECTSQASPANTEPRRSTLEPSVTFRKTVAFQWDPIRNLSWPRHAQAQTKCRLSF